MTTLHLAELISEATALRDSLSAALETTDRETIAGLLQRAALLADMVRRSAEQVRKDEERKKAA